MRKKGNKYLIRESELKELVIKSVLNEINNPNAISFDELIDNIMGASKNPNEFNRKMSALGKDSVGLIRNFLNLIGLTWNGFGGKNKSGNSNNSSGFGGLFTGDGSYDVEGSVKQYPAGGGLNSKQATFVQTLYPILEKKLRSIGKNPEFAACCTANAYYETGGKLNNGLVVAANNYSGIMAPYAQKKFGPGPGQDQPTGGVGGRPAVNMKPGTPNDEVWWYTKFSSKDDWAQYYVVELLDKQYGAFDDTLDKFGYHLFVAGRKDGRGRYGCNTQKQINAYLNHFQTMVPKILAYVRSVKLEEK